MLLPGFLFYIVYTILKHRLMPYPSLDQLRRRRAAALQAKQMGDAIDWSWKSSERVSGFGSLGLGIAGSTAAAAATMDDMSLRDMWRIARGATSGAARGKFPKDKSVVDPEVRTSVVDEDKFLVGKEADQQGDWRRVLLVVLEELADVHERVKKWVVVAEFAFGEDGADIWYF